MIFRFFAGFFSCFIVTGLWVAPLGLALSQASIKPSQRAAQFNTQTGKTQFAAADETSMGKKKRSKKRRSKASADDSASEPKLSKKAKRLLAAKNLAAKQAPSQTQALNPISDVQLAEIYKHIAQGHSRLALSTVEGLLKLAPNYRLLQLLHADLLTILAQRSSRGLKPANTPTSLSGNVLNASSQERLSQLQQEAWLRLNSYANAVKAQNPKLTPKPFILLPADEPYAMVVDSKLSRLYVYQNVLNAAPKLISDHYVTQGKFGVFKTVEGDKRTPIGVYFFTGPVNQDLPDLYGYGALGMDYPNAWDKLKGRTGHGIWMHGVPSSTYARAPYASDGCIAIANPDMAAMFALKTSGAMPIVVADKLEFVDAQSLVSDRNQIAAALTQWAGAQSADVQKLSALEYPGEQAMVLTRFELIDRNTKRVKKKEMYLKKESGQWKIALENNL